MAEKDIPIEKIFNFSNGKKGELCRVKFCRKPRRAGKRLCCRCEQHAWRVRNPTKAAFRCIKDRAVRKKISFTLTFEEFREIAEATGYVESKGRRADQLHLDRIDARKGYSADNVRVITCSENSRKGAYEKRIQLGDGRWVMLHEIGVGVSRPDDIEEHDWVDPDSLGDIDWDSTPTNELPPDHPDWTPF